MKRTERRKLPKVYRDGRAYSVDPAIGAGMLRVAALKSAFNPQAYKALSNLSWVHVTKVYPARTPEEAVDLFERDLSTIGHVYQQRILILKDGKIDIKYADKFGYPVKKVVSVAPKSEPEPVNTEKSSKVILLLDGTNAGILLNAIKSRMLIDLEKMRGVTVPDCFDSEKISKAYQSMCEINALCSIHKDISIQLEGLHGK